MGDARRASDERKEAAAAAASVRRVEEIFVWVISIGWTLARVASFIGVTLAALSRWQAAKAPS